MTEQCDKVANMELMQVCMHAHTQCKFVYVTLHTFKWHQFWSSRRSLKISDFLLVFVGVGARAVNLFNLLSVRG